MMFDYTPTEPCRCGFDGSGVHQCHAGRNPLYLAQGGKRCPNEAKNIMVPTYESLAGMQMKFTVVAGHYCEACAKEAGIKV